MKTSCSGLCPYTDPSFSGVRRVPGFCVLHWYCHRFSFQKVALFGCESNVLSLEGNSPFDAHPSGSGSQPTFSGNKMNGFGKKSVLFTCPL